MAFAAGAAILVGLDLRRRLLPAVGAGVAFLALLSAAGVLQRAATKVASGDVGTLTTQRDIGVLAAFETIRSHPALGIGPGGFASDFVRARLAAEERTGRRLVHLSTSAHFDNAHCDPLTVAAEVGVPAALALAASLVALLAGLLGAARRERQGPSAGPRPGRGSPLLGRRDPRPVARELPDQDRPRVGAVRAPRRSLVRRASGVPSFHPRGGR